MALPKLRPFLRGSASESAGDLSAGAAASAALEKLRGISRVEGWMRAFDAARIERQLAKPREIQAENSLVGVSDGPWRLVERAW